MCNNFYFSNEKKITNWMCLCARKPSGCLHRNDSNMKWHSAEWMHRVNLLATFHRVMSAQRHIWQLQQQKTSDFQYTNCIHDKYMMFGSWFCGHEHCKNRINPPNATVMPAHFLTYFSICCFCYVTMLLCAADFVVKWSLNIQYSRKLLSSRSEKAFKILIRLIGI